MERNKSNEWIALCTKISLFIGILLLCAPLRAQQTDNKGKNRTKSAIISFRWNKDILEWNYMKNTDTKKDIERIFSNKIVLQDIDSIVINASASPEGNPLHNQRLSQRRLNSVVKYVLDRYPELKKEKIRAYSLGPYWDGLRHMVENDNKVPNRKEVLELLNDKSVSLFDKEIKLKLIGEGDAYKYMEKHIFRYLRAGTAFVLFYPKRLETMINPGNLDYVVSEEKSLQAVSISPEIKSDINLVPETRGYRYIRPIALKTNLLFDAATLFNVELEVPIGKHFSIMGEWTFPFWGGLGNRGGVAPLPAYSEKYTLQMLSAGLEGRYWFPRGKRLDAKAKKWGDYNALNGWFIGLYGGCGLYDFQYNGKGMQGEFYITAGLSGGYAHAIGKHFHMEYSIGAGYLSTDYYNYHAANGQKIVNLKPNGSYDRRKQTWIGPTKAKISLVWIPQFKVKNRK